MDELWYRNVTYEDAKDMIKENLTSTIESFIASGYWLKYIRDSRAYQADGYENLWDFAEAEFGLYISEASRAMSMNDKYSIDGNSPMMLEKYKQYNKSQLQEMLTMTDEQTAQVTPDMRIKDIRKLKNPVSDDAESGNNADLAQDELESWIESFVHDEYVALRRVFVIAGLDVDVEQLKEMYGEILSCGSSPKGLIPFEGYSELMNRATGEIIVKCENDTVNTVLKREFEKMKETRDIKMRPDVKGLMDDPYCGLCGAPLNSPETEHPSMACSRCGQAVSWDLYKKYYCDVATDTVETESEEEPIEDILTEIEVAPEQEEPLNIEFDTEELFKDLNDDVIDGEYREIEETQSEEIQVSAYGLPKTEYPEGSLLTTEGCGHKHDCFSCAQDCAIRQKSRHCCEAPCGNPFDCTTMNVLASLRNDIGNECQFINLDMAEHTFSGEPDPCCKKCQINNCGYRCRRSVEVLPENIEPEQPEFPKFKNNDERRAWIEDVEAWGLWYEDPNIQARYYKYDFPDGSRLIAVKYRYTCPEWMKGQKMFEDNERFDGEYRNVHYHMLYSDEYRKKHTSEYDRYYTHATVSISILTDFIKEIAKRGKENE